MILKIEVNAPEYNIIGIKEQLAMLCEKFGDVRVVSVENCERGQVQQMNLWKGQIYGLF